MAYEIYEINTTAGIEYHIGIFSNGELLKEANGGKEYKTMKGAERKLKSLIN